MNSQDWIKHEISCSRCGVKIKPSEHHASVGGNLYCFKCINYGIQEYIKKGKKSNES